MNKKRIYYFDVLRCIACLFVVMIHVCEHLAAIEDSTLAFMTTGILDSISRVAVPIFFMISGALFLDENKNYDYPKMKKHVLNILLVLISWSFIYVIALDFVLYKVSKVPLLPFIDIFRHFIQGYDILWFLKCIIGLYLVVPILRLWVKNENKKYVKYFLIISITITLLLPTIGFIGSSYNPNFDLIDSNLFLINNTSKFLTYFILGWYLHNYLIKHKYVLYFVGCISLVLTYFFYVKLSLVNTNYLYIEDLQSIFIFFQSCALFNFIKERKFKKENTIVKSIAKHSLGIYVCHIIVLGFLLKLVEFIPYINNYYLLKLLFMCICTFLISYTISFVISKIPYVKKIVNH